ncbi:MAG: hypothetical protein RMK01_08080 [Thermomicrobium sp.]|nr:hypothetical protein [Thermomicrobium sp.]
MAPRTPKLTQISDLAGCVWRDALALAREDQRITPHERKFLTELHDLISGVRWWDQARIEAIYALEHGLPTPPSQWHARRRRELDELNITERQELERIDCDEREAA